WVAFVTGSFWGALSWLGSRSEAFWLLVPMWALAGGPVLHVLPPPRRRSQPWILRALVPVVLVLFPLGFYFSLAMLAGARASLKEAILAVYFFALSLERALLYFFGASHAVEEWIA